MAEGMPGPFRQVVLCYPALAGSYTKGEWSQESGVSIEIYASIQPTDERDLKTLPEGRYQSDAYTLYTTYGDLTSYAVDRTGDKVILYGEEYEIASKRPWGNNIINHYKYIAAKLCQ